MTEAGRQRRIPAAAEHSEAPPWQPACVQVLNDKMCFFYRPQLYMSISFHMRITLVLHVHQTGVYLPTLSRSARFSWTMGTSM